MDTYRITSTSTQYMDGSAIHHVKLTDKPGIVFSLRMWPEDVVKLQKLFVDQWAQTEEAKA